jgi:hypothetical protein
MARSKGAAGKTYRAALAFFRKALAGHPIKGVASPRSGQSRRPYRQRPV